MRQSIQVTITLNGNRPTEIRIGIDNTAAGYSIRNFHSSNPFAERYNRKLWQWLRDTGSIVKVTTLRSEDNAADGASRGRRASDTKIKQCAQLLAAYQISQSMRGLRLNEYEPTKQPSFSGKVRHSEADEAMDVLVARFLSDPENNCLTETRTNKLAFFKSKTSRCSCL